MAHTLLVYCVGEKDGNEVIKVIPESLQGLVARNVSPEPNSRIIACVFDAGMASVDQASTALRAELDPHGLPYTLAPLSAGNHLALISIQGMTCNSCVKLIETTLCSSDGVNGVRVSLQGKEAFVQFDPSVTTADETSTAIYDMGFDTSMKKVYTPAPQPLGGGQGSEEVFVEVDLASGDSAPLLRLEKEDKPSSNGKKHAPAVSTGCESEIVDSHRPLLRVSERDMVVSYKPGGKGKQKRNETTPISSLFRGKSPPLISQSSTSKEDLSASRKRVLVQVTGMSCASCVAKIESHLKKQPGVHSVLVALLTEKAEIQYDSELTDPDQLVGEIKELGFGASLISDSEGYKQGKINLHIDGMTCSSCVHLIERALLSNSVVEKAVVALATSRCHVEFDPTVLGLRDIIKIIKGGVDTR